MSACRSCGAPIEWVVTEAGRRMPLDADPVEGGNLTVDDHGRGVYVGKGNGNRVSHFASCPQAKEHRR